MNEKMKKILLWVFVGVFLVVFAIWMLSSDLKHIEDLNGDASYELVTITEQQIVKHDMGCLNLKKSKGIFSGDVIEFSSDKFTGVYEVFWESVIFSTDFVVEVMNFSIEEGNFEMFVLLDDEIVATIEPNEDGNFSTYHMGEVKGEVSLVIAGESAKFSFSIDASQYPLVDELESD